MSAGPNVDRVTSHTKKLRGCRRGSIYQERERVYLLEVGLGGLLSLGGLQKTSTVSKGYKCRAEMKTFGGEVLHNRKSRKPLWVHTEYLRRVKLSSWASPKLRTEKGEGICE